MITIFAGPIFTEWYRVPIFITVPTLITVVSVGGLLYVILDFLENNKTQSRTLSKEGKNFFIRAIVAVLSVSILFYGYIVLR